MRQAEFSSIPKDRPNSPDPGGSAIPRSDSRKRWKWLLLIPIALLSAAAGFWQIAPRWVSSPLPALEEQTPILVWRDRNGYLLWMERTFDARWREEVPLSKVSPHFLQAILATEDQNFYQHKGVDYKAILRAMQGNLTHGKILSGASTITMQLVAMPRAGNRKTWKEKWRQCLQARWLETHWSKEKILEEYVNRLPFGGQIYGIQSAAIYYFGKNAEELNWAEATMLAGIPQRPNRLRPDRHPEPAQEKQKRVLQRLLECGILTSDEVQKIRETPIFLRDTTLPSKYDSYASPIQHSPALACLDSSHMKQAITAKPSGKQTVLKNKGDIPIPTSGNATRITTISLPLQEQLFHLLKQQRDALPGVQDGAGILLDTQTGEILAAVGTLDWFSQNGQVNSITSFRCLGSTLKPFLFEEAISAGLILPDTLLCDLPLRYGTWSPKNYDGEWHGWIAATEALSHSLNAPAIRLMQQLGENRLLQRLEQLQLPLQIPKEPGLSLILGSCTSNLEAMARAYANLIRRGSGHRPDSPANAAAYLTLQMLRNQPLPQCARECIWKTGTSNGFHDAWCFAGTPQYTIGIWFGNKSGEASAQLIGSQAAAPVAGQILSLLQNEDPDWSISPGITQIIPVCAASGLAPGKDCKNRKQAEAPRWIRLPVCKTCTHPEPEVQILSPKPQTYYGNPVVLPLQANISTEWYVNQQAVPPEQHDFSFPAGIHTIHAITGNSCASLTIRVEPQKEISSTLCSP